MSCSTRVAFCDDTPEHADQGLVLLEVAIGSLLVAALLVAAAVVLLRRRPPRRPPVNRVWVSAAGDVVHRQPPVARVWVSAAGDVVHRRP